MENGDNFDDSVFGNEMIQEQSKIHERSSKLSSTPHVCDSQKEKKIVCDQRLKNFHVENGDNFDDSIFGHETIQERSKIHERSSKPTSTPHVRDSQKENKNVGEHSLKDLFGVTLAGIYCKLCHENFKRTRFAISSHIKRNDPNMFEVWGINKLVQTLQTETTECSL